MSRLLIRSVTSIKCDLELTYQLSVVLQCAIGRSNSVFLTFCQPNARYTLIYCVEATLMGFISRPSILNCKMAEALQLVLCSPLCFLAKKYYQSQVKMLKSTFMDFCLSNAFDRLYNKHLCSIELGSIKCNLETAKLAFSVGKYVHHNRKTAKIRFCTSLKSISISDFVDARDTVNAD